jgi:uncharacterized zinc-type alcohol dehydrogenase-like protein
MSTTAKAYSTSGPKSTLAPTTIQRRDCGPNDVLINVHFCGICHSDIHQARDEWGGSIFPMVPGHEIAGTVAKVGAAVTKYKVGDKVGVGCMVDSCRECASCRAGEEQFCERGSTMTYNGKGKNGEPTYGGYSSSVVVTQDFVCRIPDSIPLDAAAPLLCAGITLYSPLTHWKAGPGKKVAIVGLGGLGHMGVKIARAKGAEVTVLSRSNKKKNDSEKLGAHRFYATEEAGTFEKLEGEFDLIINTVSSDFDVDKYMGLLKRDGTMVMVGVSPEPLKLHAFSVIGGRKSLAGSPIGGIRETQEMLDFCAKHGIASDIEKIPASKINEAYERVLKSDVRYRFVIDTATL